MFGGLMFVFVDDESYIELELDILCVHDDLAHEVQDLKDGKCHNQRSVK